MRYLNIIWLLPMALASPIVINSTLNESSDDGYRLPTTQIPFKYTVDIKVGKEVLTGGDTSFEGTVTIVFKVTKATSTIKLHSKVTIDNVTLDAGNEFKDTIQNNTTDVSILSFSKNLEIGVNYTLVIKYTGKISTNDMLGFYRSNYKENGTTVYLVTTQFEPTHARSAFPCFDEPRYKAQFTISLTYPEGYTALSNTPEATSNAADEGYVKTTFTETPKMSTYLVAFIISQFSSTPGSNLTDGIPFKVWSRKEAESDRALAAKHGSSLMEALESVTNITFAQEDVGKMDIVAIPDFDAGAMENWGLITYRETAVLWDEETSVAYKQRVLTVIAHEFAHSWFGNLVTMDWWNNLFLNEGFARYYEYHALTKVDSFTSWEMDQQFVVQQVQAAFLADSSTTSPALTSACVTPSEISAKFSTISYNKGGSVLRMMINFLGRDNFERRIKGYFDKHKSCTVKPSNLFESLKEIPGNASLELSEVMANWIDKPGFPVVTAKAEGKDVILTQERFLYSGSDDTQWYVPISYTVSSTAKKFEDFTPSHWLKPNQSTKIENALDGNEWIILNNQQTGYFRVNYDSTLREKIKTLLTNNHTAVHALNRAQIVDDLFNLARAKAVDYSEALDILSYLNNETSYYPWYSAIQGINYLLKLHGQESEIGSELKRFFNDSLAKVYDTLTNITILEGDDHISKRNVAQISYIACELGITTCISTVKDLYNKLKANETKIDGNLRSTVYCNALRYSEDAQKDWDFLWKKFGSAKSSAEAVTILSALGCTRNSTILRQYLEYTLNDTTGIKLQDLTYAWSSVYSNSLEGVNVALDYFTENHQNIKEYYRSAGSLLASIADRFTTEDQLHSLSEFLKNEEVDESIKTSGGKAVTKVNENFEWKKSVQNDLEEYFEKRTTTLKPNKISSTIASKVTSNTTTSKVTPDTTASKVTSDTTASKVTSDTTASKITSDTTASKVTSDTTVSAVTASSIETTTTASARYITASVLSAVLMLLSVAIF